MISREDCLALCGLNESEVLAIAEHEHVPEMAAVALARYLLQRAGGEKVIRRMLIEDIHEALDQNRLHHARELFMALRHFLNHHPQAADDLVAY
jgi:hypothetical protein